MSSGNLATWGEHGIEVLGDLDLSPASKQTPKPDFNGPTVLYKNTAPALKAQWSSDGKYLAYATATSFNLIDAQNYSLIRSITPTLFRDSKDRLYPIETFTMDPLGNFAIIFTKFFQAQKGEEPVANAVLYNIHNSREIMNFTIPRAEDYVNLQFTPKGEYLVTLSLDGTIRVHSLTGTEMKITVPIKQDGAKCFSISPCISDDKYSIALGTPSSDNKIALAATYDLITGEQYGTKMAMSVDKFDFSWSADVRFCSVFLTCLVSRDHESYMADNRHAILHGKQPGPVFEVPLTGKNSYQIQKCAFSKRCKETFFGIIYGSMPAKTSIYDKDMNRIIDVNDGYRNDFHFSPSGRFIALGGRGSIPGKFQIYDVKRGALVSDYLRVKGSHIFEWTNSGKAFIMSVVSPQLKMDNAIHFFRADGYNYYKRDYAYLAGTSMSPILSYPEEKPLPAWMITDALKTVQDTSGRWIPPSLRDKIASEPVAQVGNDIQKLDPPVPALNFKHRL